MKDDLFNRFSSRKFLAAVVGGVVAVLAATGVIDASREQEIIAQATPVIYIVVQGAIELFGSLFATEE